MSRKSTSSSTWELSYEGKEKEEKILSSRSLLAELFYFEKQERYGLPVKGEWVNQLIYGDNLRALVLLRTLQEEGLLEKVKVVYIDPPFGTEQEFKGRLDGEVHYEDTLIGSAFFEFIRKRLIFLRELLAEDGAIFVHCDWHTGHYIKILLDEVFGEENFRNKSEFCISGFG